VQDGKGNWVYAWKEQEMFTEYTDGNGDVQTVAAQKTAYDTANTAASAATERAKRTALLMETDHYALADVTMSDAMKTYRQALRDVPQQADFPNTITWPEKP
jgi:acyl-CoA reductase-like NAD-dependent aldehyde dehydrogenase